MRVADRHYLHAAVLVRDVGVLAERNAIGAMALQWVSVGASDVSNDARSPQVAVCSCLRAPDEDAAREQQ